MSETSDRSSRSTASSSSSSHRLSLILSAVLLVALSLGLVRHARGAEELSPQQKTIADLRNVGTAMFQWYKEVQAPQQTAASHGAHGAAEKSESSAEAAHSKTVDLSQIPQISHDELAKLLVPRYIQELPAKDGWGNPYEFRLNTQDPNAVRVMAMRSSGADGKFSGTTYKIGAFPPARATEDLVWTDGYFTRWPAK